MKLALEISQQLLQTVKSKQNYDALVSQLACFDTNALYSQLVNDNEKKAFWLNIYNAFNIILLTDNPSVLLRRISRKKHFRQKKISISGISLSLDDVEHGMIRKSKIWWSKGYLTSPLVSNFEKNMRVSVLDFRIHFALNCGAKSCPAIRFYSGTKINEQLDFAAKSFIHSEVEYNKETNTLLLSKLFTWYSGDFEGELGVQKILYSYGVISKKERPKISYKKYDWQPLLESFAPVVC